MADALESPGAIRGAAIITAVDGGELPDFRRRIFRLRVETPGAMTRERLWSFALGTVAGLADENGSPSRSRRWRSATR